MAAKKPDLSKLTSMFGMIQPRKPKDKIVIGLDIGTSSIKVVKLKIGKEMIELLGCNIEPTTVDPVPALKKIIQAHGIAKVNFSVAGPSAIIRYANFPKMQSEELKQSLKFEAQKHIPFSVADVNLDACILKNDLPDNKMSVLLAAVKKDYLTQRLKILDDAGIKVFLVDIDSVALMNAFNFNYGTEEAVAHKTVALLNMGTAVSNVNILEDGMPRLSRDVHIAGNHISQKISETVGGDFKGAEEAKIAMPAAKEAKITPAIESVLSNLAREVRISFDYYESQNASSVSKIYLSGGTANLKGIKEMLAGLLGIEVDVWDPFRKLIISNTPECENMKPLANQFAVVTGLALRG